MVDSTGRREMGAAMPAVQDLLHGAFGAVPQQAAIYDLAYLLTTAEDV